MFNVKKRDLQAVATLALADLVKHTDEQVRIFFWSAGGHLYVGVRSKSVCLRYQLTDAIGISPLSVDSWTLRQAIRLASKVDMVELGFSGEAITVHPGGSTITTTMEREVPPLIAAHVSWTKPVKHGAQIISALREVAPFAATDRRRTNYHCSVVRTDDKGVLAVAGDGRVFAICDFSGIADQHEDLHVDLHAAKYVVPDITGEVVFAAEAGLVAIETDLISLRCRPPYQSRPYPDVRSFMERAQPIVVIVDRAKVLAAARAVQSGYAPQRHEHRVESLFCDISPESIAVTTGDDASLKIVRRIRADIGGVDTRFQWGCEAGNLVRALRFFKTKDIGLGFVDSERAAIIHSVNETNGYSRTALVAGLNKKT